jgi:general secretion pathway protein A
MMYRDFYGLKSAPFQLTPDPTFLFLSASHQAALDAMTMGIATRQGLVVITGVPGVGKTTLVRAYMARVAPPQLHTMVLWHARLTFQEVLARMAGHGEGQGAPDDPEAMLPWLQQWLRREYGHGRTVALIIDEAQHLPLETLEQLLVLTQRPPSGEPPLQLVLVGQPALQRRLAQVHPRAELRRLRHAVIRPLTQAERMAYIRQRVARVALPGGPIFTPEALTTLVRHTSGVPREVNLLCANVLQAGFQAQQQPITPALVRQVVVASTGGPPVPLGRRLAAAGGLVLVAGLLWGASVHMGSPTPPHSPGAPPPQSEAPPASTPPMGSLHLPSPEPVPQVQGVSSSDRAVGHDPEEGDVRLAPGASPAPPRLASPPVRPLPRVLSTPRTRPRLPSTALAGGPTLPPRLTGITSLRQGATVGQKITVEGVLTDLRPEAQVFLCVQSQAFGRRIYPQGKVVPESTGHWTVQSIYATPGYRYATFLVHTTAPQAATLLSAPHARKYGLEDLPPGAERLGPAIVVLRE